MSKRGPTKIDRHIAGRLHAARMAAGISQTAAGDRLGVSFQQIHKYEKGTNRVSAGTLMALAEIYQKPLGFFFDGAPGLNDRAKQTRDLGALMLAAHHGRRMIETFLAINDVGDRGTVIDVALAFTRASVKRQLQAAE